MKPLIFTSSMFRAILKAVPIAATTTRDHGAASILRSTSVESGFVTECCTWRPTTATCRNPAAGEGERRVTKKEGEKNYEKSRMEFKYGVDTSGR